MEPNNVPTEMPGEQSGNVAPVPEKKKSGNNALIWVILLALVAICGVGFGVWMMIDGNNQVDGLNKQISSLKSQNSELLDKLSSSDVDSKDYIYVGEWGIKIKIPENLDKVSYIFEQYSDGVGGGAGLVVSGVRGYDGRLPSFANLNENIDGLGYVRRVLVNQECDSGSTKVFSSDGFNYCYSHPQALFSAGDELIGLETESAALVTSMLNNAENYSAI